MPRRERGRGRFDPPESTFEIRKRLSGEYGFSPEDSALLGLADEQPKPARPTKRGGPSWRRVVAGLIAGVFLCVAGWQLVRGLYVMAVLALLVGALAVFFEWSRTSERKR